MHATNNKEKDQSQEKCDIFRHYKGKLKNTIADNKRFTKPPIAKLPNWRYFFEILAKLGLNPRGSAIHNPGGASSRMPQISITKNAEPLPVTTSSKNLRPTRRAIPEE
jgi:hypothetical protein